MAAPAPSTCPIAADTTADAVAVAATATIAAGSKRSHQSSSADERCVEPRRDSGDDDATAAAASTSNSDHAAPTDSTHPHPSPAARLYRHALESILAFSDLNTLSAVVRVSKEWLAAVGSMGALALQADCSTASVEFVAASAMARHVADLDIAVNVRMNADEAGSLALCMPHLRRLRCRFPLLLGDGPLLFPAGLRELELREISDPAVADINAAIAAAGLLHQLESLKIRLCRMDPLISFGPLAASPLLRGLSLSLEGSYGHEKLTDAQVAELRALPRLHHLDADPPLLSTLQRLLAQPHDLQWQRISLLSPLTDAAATLLPQLPSLTYLSLDARHLSHFEFLQRLPNLSSVLCGWCRGGLQLVDLLVAALRHCTNIAELSIAMCDTLTAAHLADLLPRLPRLHSLTLNSLSIDSLGFLAQPPLTGQLSALRLVRCSRLPLADLRHIHALRGLRELRIRGSFNERIDPDHDALKALCPPSAALPLLESFIYSAP